MAMIDSYGPSYFKSPPYVLGETSRTSKTPLQIRLQREEFREETIGMFRGYSDVETLCHMWNDLMNNLQGPIVPNHPEEADQYEKRLTDWCKRHSIHVYKMNEVLWVVRRCLLLLKNETIAIGPFPVLDFLSVFRPIALDILHKTLMKKAISGYLSVYPTKNEQPAFLDRIGIPHQFEDHLPKTILPFFIEEIYPRTNADGSLRLIRIALDIEVGPVINDDELPITPGNNSDDLVTIV